MNKFNIGDRVSYISQSKLRTSTIVRVDEVDVAVSDNIFIYVLEDGRGIYEWELIRAQRTTEEIRDEARYANDVYDDIDTEPNKDFGDFSKDLLLGYIKGLDYALQTNTREEEKTNETQDKQSAKISTLNTMRSEAEVRERLSGYKSILREVVVDEQDWDYEYAILASELEWVLKITDE